LILIKLNYYRVFEPTSHIDVKNGTVPTKRHGYNPDRKFILSLSVPINPCRLDREKAHTVQLKLTFS